MGALTWDETGKRLYETGVRKGVLYVMDNSGIYPKGVAWNGLTAVTESPSGADSNPLYADDIKYLDLRSAEEFGATIEAYTYPDEFAECDGTAELTKGVTVGQQARKTFGLCYRTVLGNDVSNDAYGYKLHLIYGATASPSEKGYQTVNDSPEAIEFSWEISTTPVAFVTNTQYKPTSLLVIDSSKFTESAAKKKLDDLENTLPLLLLASDRLGLLIPLPIFRCLGNLLDEGAVLLIDDAALVDDVGGKEQGQYGNDGDASANDAEVFRHRLVPIYLALLLGSMEAGSVEVGLAL
jgi:hypothetical protein